MKTRVTNIMLKNIPRMSSRRRFVVISHCSRHFRLQRIRNFSFRSEYINSGDNFTEHDNDQKTRKL